ncbi:hypothetical protein FB45DRAFT_1063933 [Roridomyces roridus]|uniref:Uncharacterized protein n=1 Tax=Roridomyces roridus TaxID=1738132 RepID=A0AAD7BBV9_9AGAR|nr:hypothetical protein FB45DRAFT_1063933 [Roridomyces roridus]
MHRALQIDEILRCICVQIADVDGPPALEYAPGRGDLSRLARTCTVFVEPALDSLWTFQDTLLNLLRTMPSDLWHIMEIPPDDVRASWGDVDSSLEISLLRSPRGSDWDRFKLYARRVKSFVDERICSETSVVYDTLASEFRNGTIFPMLEILHWFSVEPELFDCIHLFLSPGLTRLNIHSAPDGAISASLKLPRLKQFSIGFTRHPSISRFVCTLRDLERLVVPELDLKALNHLSRLPCLRHLWLMSPQPPHYPPPPHDLPCFPALRIFECESIEAAPNLLRRTGRSLVQFELAARSWRTIPTQQIFRELYAALASSCTHSLLEKITVEQPRHAQPIISTQLNLYVLSGDDLKKLFCFNNLVHVSLAHIIAVDLDDAVALDMARAWPRIELLLFPCDNTHRIKPRMTLEGVYAFAKHCPLLQKLAILFNATTVPKSHLTAGEKEQQPVVSQDKLEILDVAYSFIGAEPREWLPVANLLRSIFPALRHVKAMKPDSSTDARALAMSKAWTQLSRGF